MSDNKLSETFAKILIGKSIVSGLKQEPEKNYNEIKCLKCKHWQKVPLITEYNPDGTKKHPAFCDECGNNLDIQEKERKQKKAIIKEKFNYNWKAGIIFISLIPMALFFSYLYLYENFISNFNNPILDLFLFHFVGIYFISLLFCGLFIAQGEDYPNSLKEYLFGYIQLGVALLDLILFIGWYFGLFWGGFEGMLTEFYSLSP